MPRATTPEAKNAPMPFVDRARGALVGLAVGDALGTTLEFSTRDTRPHHTDMTGGGPFNLAPGVWTDDTSMALALGESLIMRGGLDPDDLMTRFVHWWKDGAYSPTGTCFDIGITTSAALKQFLTNGKPYSGTASESAAGNGSLMRLAPVALFTFAAPEDCARMAMDQSRTTHAAPQAIEACAFFADLLRRAIDGETKETLFAPRKWEGHPTMQNIAAGTWRSKKRAEIRSSGYVIHTLEAALWAVEQTNSFEDALVLAVNLGDDADSVGAVTGQLAGALYGHSAIPQRWLAPLAWHDKIVNMADTLLIPRPKPGWIDEADDILAFVEGEDALAECETARAVQTAPPAAGQAKTSLSHPLRIDAVQVPGGGLIGITFCPGKKQAFAATGAWDRDLGLDIEVIRQWGATDVVTLMESDELKLVGAHEIGAFVTRNGMVWHHLPIVDRDTPAKSFEAGWKESGPALRARLRDGGRIVVHCLGGLGRAGTIAARLLAEMGMEPQLAIRTVRAARPGAIENDQQAGYVTKIRALAG
jgi:ADP-ribosyl-[dinitrogen reductase] hydrolase